MAEASSLARPYAKALFELAQDAQNFDAWAERLQVLAQVTENETAQQAIGAPGLARDTLVDAIVGATGINDALFKNLVALLAENDRLSVAPAIAEQFEALWAEAENIVEASVVSAIELTDSQRDVIGAKLKARFGSEVKLVTHVDASLIGGAVVRVGDMVIDGSVRAKLGSLASSLTH